MRKETPNGIEHSSTRIYIFNCSYPNIETTLQDDPQIVLDVVRSKLDRFSNFKYVTLKIISVKKALTNELEIHIDGVSYFGKDKLDALDADGLRLDIQELMDSIDNFTYERVDIVADRFLENPTPNYIGKSMLRAD